MQRTREKSLFVIAILLASVLSLLPLIVADECVGQNCPANINLTIGNIAPTIPEVFPVSAITLNGGTTKVATIEFNASDENGYGDLNVSSAQVSLSKGGEATRTSTTCISIADYTLVSTISCNVTMQFYDGDGAWTITATIKDYAGDTATNDTTEVVVNTLDYVTQDVTYVNWADVTLGTDDNQADNTITLTNGGNQVYANFDVTGQNATGQTFADIINADKFSVDNVGSATTGQIYMSSNTPVDVSSKLLLDTKGASVTEQIFFYVDVPSGIKADNYLSDSAWAIQLS